MTAIEDWLRDPYTIYAKYVLKLLPLDTVDMPLSAADRGSAIYDALGDFTKISGKPARRSAGRVARHRRKPFRAADAAARGARAVVATLPAHRGVVRGMGSVATNATREIYAEVSGKIEIPINGDRNFILSARADRIEHLIDGRFAVLDYKTGSPPSNKQVRLGLSPQLTLESAILRKGGFEGIPAGAIGQRTRVCPA